MNEPEKPKKGWGCLQWGVVIVVLLMFGVGLLWPVFVLLDQQACQTSVTNHARQTIIAMKIWSQENNGAYPDSAFQERPTANQVFRKLIQDDIVMDERIFGSKVSFFNGDGKIGAAPAFDQAVQAGENHWMITAGLNTKSPREMPFIFENAISSTWPLRWFSSHQDKLIRGRVWRNGKIIVGFHDNSVSVVDLKKQNDVMVLPDMVMIPKGKTPLPPLKILDIE
jgi:hypothetical protein